MGALLSFFWGTPVDPGLDIPDKVTGLTPRERAEVVSSWELVKKDIKGNGESLFIGFFTRFPEHQKRFSAFAAVPLSELRGNKKLQAHANGVMYALTSIVDNLADPECLIEMLLKLGGNHVRHKVPEQGFKDLKAALLDFLKSKLGSRLSKSAEATWSKTIDVAYSAIFQGMEAQRKLEDKKKQTHD